MNPIEPSTTMLEDLLLTDEDKVVSPVEEAQPRALEFTSESGFTNLDLRKLNHEAFAVIIAVMMKRFNASEIVINDAEVAALNPPSGLCTVLACEINPDTADIRLTVKEAKASEFRT